MKRKFIPYRTAENTNIPQTDTFYIKMWQTNGFYPVFKFIKEKDNQWAKYLVCLNGNLKNRMEYTTETLKYFFEHNAGIVSDIPMTDHKCYNDK